MRMLHEIAPHKYNNDYSAKRPPVPKDVALYYDDSTVMMKNHSAGRGCFTFEELEPQAMQEAEYIFSIDDTGYYLLENAPQQKDLELYPISSCRELCGTTAFAFVTGWQFYRFRKEHKFCSCCATPLERHAVDRAYQCPNCGFVCYPKFSPAILALVTDGDRCMLVRSRRFSSSLSPVAGFVEVGESFEEAVEREVFEEAGIRVKDVRYIASQPWSYGDTIMIGFTAKLDGSEKLTPQQSELLDAGWYHRSELEDNRFRDSLGGQLVQWFKEGRL